MRIDPCALMRGDTFSRLRRQVGYKILTVDLHVAVVRYAEVLITLWLADLPTEDAGC